MREYIITDKQLKTATEAYLEHELSRPITDVFVSGDKLPEIVRCRDCKWYGFSTKEYSGCGCMKFGFGSWNKESLSNGFCAWGERKGGDDE